MNSSLGSNFWDSVTIRIDLVQIRLNSLWQTKYCSYLQVTNTWDFPNDTWPL